MQASVTDTAPNESNKDIVFENHALTTPGDRIVSLFRNRLISGSVLLIASATLVNLGNYLFNLILGRWLGPAAFADLSLIVTLFLMTSFITAAFQTPAARFAAMYMADNQMERLSALRRWLVRIASGFGLVALILFAVAAPLWSNYFNTASSIPFIIYGLFAPFYIVQGVDRGLLQGETKFSWLALTYQGEMWSRLFLSLLFVGIGLGTNGAVLGIGLSFFVAWLMARRVRLDLPLPQALAAGTSAQVLTFAGPVLVAQLSQILINNSDILIVRRFYGAEEAGLYAALALTGRIVFFATWSVVVAMFPIVTQRHQRGESHRILLYASLSLVALISAVFVAAAYLFPTQIVSVLFGSAYLGIAPLLWVYAAATMFYALANVVVHYKLALGRTGGAYLAILVGIAQIALLWLFHETLLQVVLVQMMLMIAFLVIMLFSDVVDMMINR